MKYSIVIPTFNHCDDLLKPCIESVLTYTQMDQIQLIVVANGCTDNTWWYLERLRNQFNQLGFGDHFEVVWSDQPLGFAPAVNKGLAVAKGERLVLLNNDVVLLPQAVNSWIARLNQPFEQGSNVGITCTLKLWSDQTQRHFGVFFCVMIDKKVVTKIGPLPEAYPVGGGEDIEYCWLAENAGYSVECVTQNTYSQEAGTNVSDFPIWHKAEGTMHDPNSVPNWHEVFPANMKLLAQRVEQMQLASLPAIENSAGSLTGPPSQISWDSVVQKLTWMADHNQESRELFDEVIANNTYHINQDHIKNHLVIDIGANQGMFSILSAELGAAHVIAVEPVSSTYELLQSNIKQAGHSTEITTVKKIALGKPDIPRSISVNPKSGHNSVYKSTGDHELVATASLTQLIAMWPGHEPVFLKMDCEGSEHDILWDSEPETWSRISAVAVEIHGNMHPIYKSLEEFQNKLASLGFRLNHRNQVGIWWKDSLGQVVKFDPMPQTVELWTK
jgi:FkbM family methyltransferase